MPKKNVFTIIIICAAAVLAAIAIGILTFTIYTNSYENKRADATAAPLSQASPAASAAPTAVPNQPSVLYVTNVQNSIYLRLTPDDNGTILTTIPVGSAVYMISNENNGYTHIRYNGTEGYSKTEYLTADSAAANHRPVEPAVQYPASGLTEVVRTMYVYNVENAIYLRTGASESADIITTIPLGAAVGYITDIGNGFYKIKYNGQMGYSKAKYLTTYNSGYYSDSSVRYMRVTGVKNSIYLRRSPSADSSNICEIPVGARVRFIERYNDNYYRISYGGSTGYATAQYLTFE